MTDNIDPDIDQAYRALKASTHMDGPVYRAKRVVIRICRVAAGLALAFAGLLVLGETPSVSDVPFSQLTFGMIGGSIFGWALTLLVWYWACKVAFGAAPTEQEVDYALLSRASAGDRPRDGK